MNREENIKGENFLASFSHTYCKIRNMTSNSSRFLNVGFSSGKKLLSRTTSRGKQDLELCRLSAAVYVVLCFPGSQFGWLPV